MISIDDLTTPIDQETTFQAWLTSLEAVGLPAKSWKVGGISRTILRTVAGTYAGFTVMMSDWIKGGFLDTSSGNWLTALAHYVYGVERITATFATGVATFKNTGGGIYSYTTGQVRILQAIANPADPYGAPIPGKAYTNAAPFTSNPGTSVDVAIVAVEQGSASSAAPLQIKLLETMIIGVTVSNAAAVVGVDQELDSTLQQRCRDKLAALSLRGPRGAYAYAVSAAVRLDGTPVNINRRSISSDPATGIVSVYVAAPGGAPIAADVTAVALSIENNARPDTVTVNTIGASAVALTQSITVWATRTTGLDAPTLSALVSAALILAIQTYPIGGIAKPPATQGYLWLSYIDGVVKGAHPAIYAIDGTADLSLAPGTVASLASTIAIRFTDLSQ